jgi:hypothetical protein
MMHGNGGQWSGGERGGEGEGESGRAGKPRKETRDLIQTTRGGAGARPWRRGRGERAMTWYSRRRHEVDDGADGRVPRIREREGGKGRRRRWARVRPGPGWPSGPACFIGKGGGGGTAAAGQKERGREMEPKWLFLHFQFLFYFLEFKCYDFK